MYKVITHTITEEHFDHPKLAEQGMYTNGHKSFSSNVNAKPYYGKTVSTDSGVITCPPTDGNLIVKLPVDGEWGGYEYWGEYHCWGDLMVHGSATINGDLTVDGAIVGRGTTNNITILETAPTSNTWTGNVGELARNTNFMYLCVEPDKWIRWSIQSTW